MMNSTQIIAVKCDNASNNDMMIEELKILHTAEGLEFNSLWA